MAPNFAPGACNPVHHPKPIRGAELQTVFWEVFVTLTRRTRWPPDVAVAVDNAVF